jgi:hypothetical protein
MAPSLTSNNAISIPLPVLLTPRPMTDEELAMPMTKAPKNKSTPKVISPLASSDSGAFPPSSKKVHTTSLSTAMNQYQLKSTKDNGNDVKVVDAEVEGATANEEIKWSLCRPESLGKKVQSKVWNVFKVFHHGNHPDKKGQAACILCFNAKSYDCGTICSKGGNTSGLIHHIMKLHHTKH